MAFLGSKRRGSDCLILFISLKAWDYNLKYLFLKKDASQKKKDASHSCSLGNRIKTEVKYIRNLLWEMLKKNEKRNKTE